MRETSAEPNIIESAILEVVDSESDFFGLVFGSIDSLSVIS